jgi:hypothetical protein
MKPFVLAPMLCLLLAVPGLVIANPALLPKHPGYPAEGNANDAGQHNLTLEQSLAQGAASEDAHTTQSLVEPIDGRILKSQGAGRLPTVQGPDIKIAPPVQSGTRMMKE